MGKTKESIKKGNRKKWWLYSIVTLLVVCLAGGFSLWSKVYETYPYPAPRPEATAGITNWLILGTDDYDYHKQTGRADSIMVMSIAEETGDIVMLSLPRDSRLEKKAAETRKLGEVMYYGGTEQMIAVVERLLDIPLDGYVHTNLIGLEQIVDGLGGVDIRVPFAMEVRTSEPRWVDLEPGINRLDGRLALAYLRFRSDREADFGRMRRHREFLTALFQQALRIRNTLRLPMIARRASEHIKTDITITEGLWFARLFRRIDFSDIAMVQAKGRPKNLGGTPYVLLDGDFLKRMVDVYIRRTEDKSILEDAG